MLYALELLGEIEKNTYSSSFSIPTNGQMMEITFLFSFLPSRLGRLSINSLSYCMFRSKIQAQEQMKTFTANLMTKKVS